MIRKSYFRFPYQYFHLNFEFNVFPQFKKLDWLFLCHNLNKVQLKYSSLEFHALIMMDSHVHLLFRISDQAENFFVNDFFDLLGSKKPTEMLVEPIGNYKQYLNTYKYIYNNPVGAGLCQKCEDYEFSSLNALLGQSVQYVKVVDTVNLIQKPSHVLLWLNSNKNYFDQTRQDSSFLM